jgi:hypothetical protein
MDLITDLSPIDGCDSILVMVDRGNTKGAILILMTKTLTQEGAGQLLLHNLYKQFGLPDKILSDQGPQFAAKAFLLQTIKTSWNQIKLDNGLSPTDRWHH